jgi:hypothetical protein
MICLGHSDPRASRRVPCQRGVLAMIMCALIGK